jgi:hypothetical protein
MLKGTPSTEEVYGFKKTGLAAAIGAVNYIGARMAI